MTPVTVNFRIPKRYRRTFLLKMPRLRVAILTRGGKVMLDEITREDFQACDALAGNCWVADVIRQIRRDCRPRKKK